MLSWYPSSSSHPFSTPPASLSGFPGPVNGTLNLRSPRTIPVSGGKAYRPVWSVDGTWMGKTRCPLVSCLGLDLEEPTV